MALRTKVLLALTALMVFATAAVAVAESGISTTLISGLSEGYYGQDLMLMPQVTTEPLVVPGAGLKADKFEFQYCDNGTWTKIEDQLVEDTATVSPMMLVFDNEYKYPADFRVLFYRQSLDASGVANYVLQSTSDTVTVDARRYAHSSLSVSAAKYVNRNAAYTPSFSVNPNVGEGSAYLQIQKRSGSRWVRYSTKTIALDETSYAKPTLKFSHAGAYRLVAKFKGNQWAPASASTYRVFTVR